MKRSIIAATIALAATTGLMAQGQPAPAQPAQKEGAAGPKQPQLKSKEEQTAVMALFQAQPQGPDAVIKAADELLTKFADTEFKEAALTLQSQAYKAKGEEAKAQVTAERLLEVNPKNFQAQVMLGEIIVKNTKEFDLDREEKLTKSDKYFADAIAAVKAAPKPNPQITDEQWTEAQKQVQAESHNGIGMAALTRKKYDVAINEFKAASDLDPQEYTYTVRLASAYQLAGKNAEAAAAADKVLAASDVHPQVKAVAQQIKNATTKK